MKNLIREYQEKILSLISIIADCNEKIQAFKSGKLKDKEEHLLVTIKRKESNTRKDDFVKIVNHLNELSEQTKTPTEIRHRLDFTLMPRVEKSTEKLKELEAGGHYPTESHKRWTRILKVDCDTANELRWVLKLEPC